MSAVVLHLLLFLLVHEAAAMPPSASSLPPTTEAISAFQFSDVEILMPQMCSFCDLSVELCTCLRGVPNAWCLGSQTHVPQHSLETYTVDTQPDTIGGSRGVPSPLHTDTARQNSTISPKDLLNHPEWPLDDDTDPMEGLTMYDHDHDHDQDQVEDPERLDEARTTAEEEALLPWLTSAYNVGDRLSPPRPALTPRKRQAKKPGGYPCNVSDCSEVFDRDCDLTRHQKKHVDKSERPHKCSQCDKAFTYPKDRERHESTHKPQSQTKTYMCTHSDCKSSKTGFSRKDNLRRHMRDKHSISSINTQTSSPYTPGS